MKNDFLSKKFLKTNVMKTLDLKSVNLSVLEKKANSNRGHSIYKYSDEILKSADFKAEKKKRRKQIRSNQIKICLQIQKEFSEKQTVSSELKKEFETFYKENFLTNDFSPASFTAKSETENANEYNLCYNAILIMNEVCNTKEKTVKENAK